MEWLQQNPIVEFVLVIFCIWLFLKFCAFAKKFSLPGKLKTWTYIIFGAGVVVFNYLFGKAKLGQTTESYVPPELMGTMGIVLAASLLVVLLFTFVLVSETKEQ
ncbi:MAG: hypothetical protein ACM3MK_07805 [Chitinophagales bacterium]